MTAKPGSYGIEDLMSVPPLRSGYWKAMGRLRHDRIGIEVAGAELRFSNYPFELASVFPDGSVSAGDIVEINLTGPAQVRLPSGEILFVPHVHKDALLTFINRNDVPVRRRESVWSALLDPFLDTWVEQGMIDGQFAWLARLGLDRAAVDAWRREVAASMMAYNFGSPVWEWCNLDLYDVLIAQCAWLNTAEFADFYRRALPVAALDPPRPTGLPFVETDMNSALGSALIEWYPREPDGKSADFSKNRRHALIEQLKHRLIAELTAAYSQPQRRYHTKGHIDACLVELGQSWESAVHLNELRWALLFHDAIYDPQRKDNELRSADWACAVMDELQRPAEEKARVRELIMATMHSGEPRTSDEALLVDIDLSILGTDEKTFDAYDQAIRVEYDWVPIDQYRRGRRAVLQSFLERQPIYRTALYRSRYEAQAKSNLQRALARLPPDCSSGDAQPVDPK